MEYINFLNCKFYFETFTTLINYPTLLVLITFVWIIIFLFISNHGSKTTKPSKLPPGPSPYSIIGNILNLGLYRNPLHSLTLLSKTYGPIITLKIGSITTIVISSPQIAKEALCTKDKVFCNRVIPDTMRALDHDKASIAWMPASSSKWRSFRRACATRVFSPQQLDSTRFHRQRKVQDLLDYVNERCNKGEAFDFGEAIFITVFNSLSNTFFSMDLLHYDNNSAKNSDKCQSHHNKHIKEIICGIVEEMARPNVSDIFPFLRVFDIQGARARMTNHYTKLFAFFDGVIEGRMLLRTSDSKKFNDVLDSLIDLIEEGSSQLSRHDIIHLFGDMFIAGLDTTSTTLEWAMAELLHNPIKLVKVREELQHKLVNFGQIVEESHASSKFPYLCAVLKETLRLHPPAPFLLPHKSNADIELAGFMIPKGAQVRVNVWSIGRDSSIWTNPDLFEPERFLECDIDFKGKGGFELIPFGAGRRICPGLPLASRFMHFILASLLHHFDWKLPDDDLNQQDMNMDHKFEFTIRKAQSLRVIPIKV